MYCKINLVLLQVCSCLSQEQTADVEVSSDAYIQSLLSLTIYQASLPLIINYELTPRGCNYVMHRA